MLPPTCNDPFLLLGPMMNISPYLVEVFLLAVAIAVSYNHNKLWWSNNIVDQARIKSHMRVRECMALFQGIVSFYQKFNTSCSYETNLNHGSNRFSDRFNLSNITDFYFYNISKKWGITRQKALLLIIYIIFLSLSVIGKC